MKKAVFAMIVFNLQNVFAQQDRISCAFPDHIYYEDCIEMDGENYKIKESVLKKIKFSKRGLVEGQVKDEGCYWLHKKNVIRKSHCVRNAADAFKEGLSRYVDPKGLYGFMDEKLEIKIPAKYTFAFPFEKGKAEVCNECIVENEKARKPSDVKGGERIIINKQGTELSRTSPN